MPEESGSYREQQDKAMMKTALGARPLIRVGNSWAVLLPKFWVDAYSLRRFGKLWVRRVEGVNTITLGALDPAEVHRLIGEEVQDEPSR